MDDRYRAGPSDVLGQNNRETSTIAATGARPNNNSIVSTARLNQNPDRQTSSNSTTNPSTSNTVQAATATTTGVQQPKPQALPKRTGPSSIIVSPRQKGNPVLSAIKSVPWEYGDIPADYILGLTTCALFLSLKYHRLHPEYIYTRIKALQGKFLLRIVLCLVDITNHEESLRELSKTSLINNVTLVLCWSSQEGGRYIELFKTYEHASHTSIKSHQSNAYSDRMIDFITTPRSINKTDAVSLVSQFGTLRTAVNARYEEVAGIAGWGEKKVQQWTASVREPFRVRRAARRGVLGREDTGMSGRTLGREDTGVSGGAGSRGNSASPTPASLPRGESDTARRSVSRPATADADKRPSSRLAETITVDNENDVGREDAFADDEEALAEAMTGKPVVPLKRQQVVDTKAEQPSKKRKPDDDLSEGVMAALIRLRKDGG